MNYYIDDNHKTVDSLLTDMEDLQRYGCVSGMIKSLIYYDDTNKFYNNYKEEINELLSNVVESSGLSFEDLFGDKFDNTDCLILEYSNKNLLAWFGFEETANSIYEQVLEKFKQNDTDYSH